MPGLGDWKGKKKSMVHYKASIIAAPSSLSCWNRCSKSLLSITSFLPENDPHRCRRHIATKRTRILPSYRMPHSTSAPTLAAVNGSHHQSEVASSNGNGGMTEDSQLRYKMPPRVPTTALVVFCTSFVLDNFLPCFTPNVYELTLRVSMAGWEIMTLHTPLTSVESTRLTVSFLPQWRRLRFRLRDVRLPMYIFLPDSH